MSSTIRAVEKLEPLSMPEPRPSRAEVEAAVRTIIRWTGDDPDREGLQETPARVTRALEDYFSGYAQVPDGISRAHFRGGRRL